MSRVPAHWSGQKGNEVRNEIKQINVRSESLLEAIHLKSARS